VSVVYPPEELANQNAAEEQQQEGAVQMLSSQQTAAIAALRYLGKPVKVVPMVDSVQPGTPADGVLKANDQLLAVNGEPVNSFDDVSKAVQKVGPNEKVTVTVERDGKRRTETMTTVAAPDDPKQGRIGILVGEGYQSPIDVNISLGNVGGPSGGLMFTLSVIDKLTPGSLTDGNDIAGTGTMSSDGKVGPIGGIEQKMAGASAAGADLFLAPSSNCDEVVGHIPDGLTVAKVDSLDDALSVIKKFNAGDTDLPTCSAQS
jgi:Lon-like protease